MNIMTLQYLQDNKGATTAVVVPIEDWNRITEKYSDLEEIPQWQKKLIDSRLAHLQSHPQQVTSLEDFLSELDTEDGEV